MSTDSKARRLSSLLKGLLLTRDNLKKRFPIPYCEDPSQLIPEEGMMQYRAPYVHQTLPADAPHQRNVIMSVPLKSGRAEATEHEEPALVTFLLMGYNTHSSTYRGIDELHLEGMQASFERITLMGKAAVWSDFTPEQMDEMIWYVDYETQMWKERLDPSVVVTINEPTPAEQIRELAMAVEKLDKLDPTNPFLSVVGQTASVFLEKINKQIEKVQVLSDGY